MNSEAVITGILVYVIQWEIVYLLSNTCARMDTYPQIKEQSRLNVESFLEISPLQVLQCARECQLRSACVSFNYNTQTRQCFLNTKDSADVPSGLEANGEFIHSDIQSWPKNLAEGCINHGCPMNTFCESDLHIGITCIQEVWNMTTDQIVTTKGQADTTSQTDTTTSQADTTTEGGFKLVPVTVNGVSVKKLEVTSTLTSAEIENLIITHGACLESCIGIANGDYQFCGGCTKYATCSNHILTERPCPSTVRWDQNIRECVASSSTCLY
ncbi:uncharacterized protein LOC126829658 [Patella vulgata]|uniref:uncharacterized protein LOC126829658 n=1 Tax=Patella vulgata TaxID=6465 RepID=UPI00217F38C0|nr:uncharacterized protein LOC126829658 [Patella vulgata]